MPKPASTTLHRKQLQCSHDSVIQAVRPRRRALMVYTYTYIVSQIVNSLGLADLIFERNLFGRLSKIVPLGTKLN